MLNWTTQYFEDKGIENARLSAEMLLAHVLGEQRIRLYMDMDRPASELERAAFRELVERAAAHEPIDYLVEQTPFYSMMLKVSPAVLVPRPSTETLIDQVLRHARVTPGFHEPTIVDIGTGSGAIAIALARHFKNSHIIATDISEDALAVAKENAAIQKVSQRIDFRQGDLYEPVKGERFHYVLSNPPYISDEEWESVEPNVKDYEPHHALRGGVDGLDIIRRLIAGSVDHLEEPGQLVIEFAASQKKAVLALANEADHLTNAHILADHEHLPRMLVADRAE